MRKHVIYARKSSESEDRQILSIDAQVRQMKDIARRHGIEVSEVLTEMRSAKAPGRPIFDALMRRVDRGEIGTILSWKMDRLTRNHRDSGNLMHVLAEGLIQQIITIDGVTTPSGNDRLMGTMELAFATKFIDDLKVNTKRGLEERLRLGWATYLPPPGYLNDVINKTIVSDRNRLPMIKKILDLHLSGAMLPEQIRREANDKWGFRTVQRKRSGGKPLTRSMIYKILSHPFYAGFIPSKGRLLPGKHEAIITWEEFQHAQALLHRQDQRRPKRHDFAFTGIFKCGTCGSAMTAEEHIKPNGRRYVYYRCCRTRATSEHCGEPAVPESQVTEQLARSLGRLTIPAPVLAWMKRKVMGVLEADHARGELVRKTLDEALRSTEREIANLLDLRLRELVPDEVFTAKRRELEQRKISLEQRHAKTGEAGQAVGKQLQDLFDFAAGARQRFMEGSAVQQRTILEAVGSNYRLSAKKVSFQMAKPLQLVAEAGIRHSWLRLVDDLRTWALNASDYFKVPNFAHEGMMAEMPAR